MGSIVTRTKPKYPVKETLNMSINIAREAMGESQSSYGATSYKDVAWFIVLYICHYE